MRAHLPASRKLSIDNVHVEFLVSAFCDAPHTVCAEQGGGGEDSNSLGWWFSREDNYYKAIEFSDCDKGFKESVDHIRNVLVEQVGHSVSPLIGLRVIHIYGPH